MIQEVFLGAGIISCGITSCVAHFNFPFSTQQMRKNEAVHIKQYLFGGLPSPCLILATTFAA